MTLTDRGCDRDLGPAVGRCAHMPLPRHNNRCVGAHKMLWPIVLLLLHVLPLWTESIQRLAIVRPFAAKDYSRLPRSFDAWNTRLPCSTGDAASTVEVDLYLCYSLSWDFDPAAQAMVHDVVAAFASRSDPWHSCFSQVYAVTADLLPSEDRYITGSGSGNDTAQGPNLQFIRIAQNFVRGTWGHGAYDSFMLMEMDTVPVRRGWLAAMIEELDANAPYAVYGSNYRGSRWDAFYPDMTLPMRYHINGNAVYNTTSPAFWALLANVTAQATTLASARAYDILMAETVLQDQPALPSALPTVTPEAIVYPPLRDLYKPTAAFISNYVHMTMVPKFFGQEYLVHGVNLGLEWDPGADPIALVVSDWGDDADLAPLLDSLRTGDHPFREVVVLRPAAALPAVRQVRAPVTVNGTHVADLMVRYQARTDEAYNDWCVANVTSAWLAYTNIYFTLRSPARLVRAADGRPMLHYLSNTSCAEHASCTASLARAAAFAGPGLAGHFDTHETVFRSDKRRAFCAEWRAWYADHAPACDPVLGPTADDYMAWLGRAGEAAALYAVYDKHRTDVPSFTVRREVPPVDPRPCSLYNDTHREALLANSTGCAQFATQAACAGTICRRCMGAGLVAGSTTGAQCLLCDMLIDGGHFWAPDKWLLFRSPSSR